MKELKPFTVQITIPKDRIVDLLCGALEGGSNYWAHFQCSVDDFYDIDDPTWRLSVDDVDGGDTFTLKREDLAKGLQILSEIVPHHYSNFIKEDDDAETADCFLQCCVFEDVVYS
jgi:hypothetical protein